MTGEEAGKVDIDLYILLFYLPDISYIFIFKMLSSIHQSFNVPFFTIQNAHCHWRHQLYVHIKSGLSFVSICHHMRMYIKVWFTCVSTIWSLAWTHATRSDPEKELIFGSNNQVSEFLASFAYISKVAKLS